MNVKVLVIASALLAVGFTWWIEGIRWDKDVSSLNESHALELKSISDKAFNDLAAANKRTAEAQAVAAKLDKKHTEELAHALAENEALVVDVDNGNRRVRIAAANLATCQLTAGQHTATGRVGNATQVELTAKAGRNVLDIRAGIISDQAKLDYLQEYVRSIQVAR